MSEHVPDAGNMVERVADAIGCLDSDRCIRFRADGKARTPPKPPCDRCLEAARAAIAAMREPTEAMRNAAAIDSIGPHDMQIFWEEMIDEALK